MEGYCQEAKGAGGSTIPRQRRPRAEIHKVEVLRLPDCIEGFGHLSNQHVDQQEGSANLEDNSDHLRWDMM